MFDFSRSSSYLAVHGAGKAERETRQKNCSSLQKPSYGFKRCRIFCINLTLYYFNPIEVLGVYCQETRPVVFDHITSAWRSLAEIRSGFVLHDILLTKKHVNICTKTSNFSHLSLPVWQNKSLNRHLICMLF